MKAFRSAKLILFRRFAWPLITLILGISSVAQQPVGTTKTVPNVMTFSGTVPGAQSGSRVTGITFALYKDEDGGAPLWIETQNVAIDVKGHYSVQLGATTQNGVPLDLFASGDARWLGVRAEGLPEQPRVLLVSVPYALKAADADTIGGRPASAFVLAPTAEASVAGSANTAVTPPPPITGTGTANFVPLWTSASGLGNSVLFQSGSGTTAKLGINTTAPTNTLDVRGSAAIRGLFSLPATGVATAAAGKNSQPTAFTTSSFNSGTSTAVNQTFRWQAEPVGNNTATASGTLNLLFAQGSAAPAETGLKVASNGRITFAPGQTFPVAGTVKSVALTAPASDFTVTGSPVTGTGTLGLNWNVTPTDTNTASAIVKRDATGSFNANNVTLTGTLSTNTSNPFGIIASSSSSSGAAITASATATTGTVYGVYGSTNGDSSTAVGVYGVAGRSLNVGETVGVEGVSASPFGTGVFGRGASTTATYGRYIGVQSGIWADSSHVGLGATGDDNWAIFGANNSHTIPTLALVNFAASPGLSFRAEGPTGLNCRIDVLGDLACSGTITANAGFASRIDHPLDPANRYLSHAAVESSEALHLYTGNVRLDARGEATVQMPAWFDAANVDFRYQLTAVGAPGPNLYVAQEIESNIFRIAGGSPGMKVSWQVTCLRNDPYAKAHPLVVEEAKPAADRGFYEHPELYGQPTDRGIFSRQHNPLPGTVKAAANVH